MKTKLFCILFFIPAIVFLSSAFANDADDLLDAALRGNIRQVQALLEKGVDVNSEQTKGTTALWPAAANGHTEIVKLLLKRDADLNAKTHLKGKDYTPLSAAKEMGRTEIIKLLKEYGAKD